ncbi:hypothetical protein Q8F55_006682 [Vanrija albida]|uniref:MARVEL domain-containing protein n=1 Tax=Vanrija albida TaxID=181172 RepID=A0ABR3PXU2_9TREE
MPALLTASQSRWALHAFIAILSAAAIASSAARTNGVGDMLSGSRGREGHRTGTGSGDEEDDGPYAGDVRGVIVLVGGAGLGGVLLLRGIGAFVPRPWRVYLDRLEFNFAAMLWILWTSATMAFSAAIVDNGVCARSLSSVRLPSCPLLTFDLTILHLLSVSSLALVLVILSAVVRPGYEMSHSLLSDSESDTSSPGKSGGLVLWDMALAPIPEPAGPSSAPSTSTYGAVRAAEEQPPDFSPPHPPRDKFAEGRLWSYAPLVACSVGVVICAAVLAGRAGASAGGSAFIIVTGVLSTIFGITCLAVHFTKPADPKRASWDDDESLSFLRTYDRAIEVGTATLLFLLWPLAAVVYTMFPATANRPCMNPKARGVPDNFDPGTLHGYGGALCQLSAVAIVLAWLASWILFARVLGLMFPMPSAIGWREAAAERREQEAGEEGRGLLARPAPAASPEVQRPQVKYGRIVAGEAFELGDDEED